MTLAILQARVSSSRLPMKVLVPILSRPMLALQIERLRRSKHIDKLVVATSTDPNDDEIEVLAHRERVEIFRGSLEDVLDRFYQGAKRFLPEHVIRLTGDSPLTYPTLIEVS